MKKIYIILIIFIQCKIFKHNDSHISYVIHFNKNNYDIFGIPIKSEKSILSIPVGFSSPITFEVDTNLITFFPVKKNILRFECKSVHREITGTLLILKDITEVSYNYTYDMETFLVSTLNVYEFICPIRIGEWVYREGNNTSKIKYSSEIKKCKIINSVNHSERE